MDRTTRKRHSALMIVAMALGVAVPGAVFAQQGLKEQIVGTWTPVSQYVDQDGKRIEPFGSNPKGIVVYDGKGRFVLVLQRASLPRFVSSNRMTGSAEENKAIVQGALLISAVIPSTSKNRRSISITTGARTRTGTAKTRSV